MGRGGRGRALSAGLVGIALALSLCLWAGTENGDRDGGLGRLGGLAVSLLGGGEGGGENSTNSTAAGPTKGFLNYLPWYESEIVNVTDGSDGEMPPSTLQICPLMFLKMPQEKM